MTDPTPSPDTAPQGRILSRAELEERLDPLLCDLRHWIRRRVGRSLKQREPVSDIVQSTVREIVEQAESVRFTTEAAFRRWVHQVASNKVVSKSRFHAAERRASDRAEGLESRVLEQAELAREEATPSVHAARLEDLERLERALEELGQEDREIVCLRRFFDLPSPAIAAKLGMPESTVRWRLARALAFLAARLR